MSKMTDTEILDFLEKTARKSSTGVSFDYVPSVDGEPSGFRFMRRFWVGNPAKTLREAIEENIHLFNENGSLRRGDNR